MNEICVLCGMTWSLHWNGEGYGSCPIYKEGKWTRWHPTNRFTPRREEQLPCSHPYTKGSTGGFECLTCKSVSVDGTHWTKVSPATVQASGVETGRKKPEWLALIQGGVGPDVWDKEVGIDAVDFLDAANQASGKAEYYGGYVASLESYYADGQTSCPRCQELEAEHDKFVAGISKNIGSCAACAEVVFCGSASIEHAPDCVYTKRDELRKALVELAAKLDAIEKHPRYQSVWTSAHMHGFTYDGPNWEQELIRAKALLENGGGTYE